ncbi:MAG: hypothetical protein HN521_01545 [Candidatus Latescibacteria bacterium]|nr:hypothetical protein [Candidatus Latescibacterota bacterium]
MRLLYGLICVCFTLAPALAQDEGYVLQVAGRLVFVDQGEQDNLRPGDLLQVIRKEVIKHPETGENLAGEVVLGAVRIVEVFPRLSTAEVVDLIKAMDMELLDRESRQGLIRTRVLPPEVEMIILERVQARESGMMAPPDEWNPDGILREFIAGIRFGLGSRPDVSYPPFAYQLIDKGATIGTVLPQAQLVRTDAPFANVLDLELLTLADTTSTPQELVPFGGSLATQIGLEYPFSQRLTLLADLSFGSFSQMSVGGRYYAGRLLKFLGQGYTPDGPVGAPVISLNIGMGGKGSSALSQTALKPLAARNNLSADSLYTVTVLDTLTTEFVNIDPAFIARADSFYQADVTRLLQVAANEGSENFTKSGLGFSVDLTWPLARHFSFRAHWTLMGKIKEYGGKLTYFMRSVEKADPRVNPDGRIRSLVMSLGGRYDTAAKQRILDFSLVVPIAQRYTFSGIVETDFKNSTRFGMGFKTYVKGF